MSLRHGRTVLLAAFVVLAATTAWAQLGNAVGRGTVTDHEGNPLKGVTVVFQNTANEKARFETTTNKKGRFYLDNLLYYNTGKWIVTVSMDGYVPTKMEVESRTQQAVVGKLEVKLSPDKSPTEIDIRAFGTATFEFTLVPQAVWDEQNAAAVTQVTEAATGEAGEAAPRDPQEDAFQKAFRLAGAGELDESLPFFEEAAESAPDDAELLEGWANVLYRLERSDEAVARAEQSIAADPERPGAYRIVYSAAVAREDWAGAGETLDRIAENLGTDRWVLEQRAQLASRSGDPQSAIAAYEQLVETDPANKEAWVALGAMYADAGRNDESRAAFQKVVELDPSGAYKTFFNIGALILNQDNISAADTDRAVAAFRKAIEIKPDYAPAHRQLAYALLSKGDLEGARASLEAYLKAAPDAPDAAQVQAMVKSLGGG